MYTLKTNTGKTYKCTNFGITPMGFVIATIEGINMPTAVTEFSKPEETETITAQNQYGDEMTVRGYTVLQHVELLGTGIKIALARPSAESENTP